jgi:hypothetical protein
MRTRDELRLANLAVALVAQRGAPIGTGDLERERVEAEEAHPVQIRVADAEQPIADHETAAAAVGLDAIPADARVFAGPRGVDGQLREARGRHAVDVQGEDDREDREQRPEQQAVRSRQRRRHAHECALPAPVPLPRRDRVRDGRGRIWWRR